MVGLSRKTTGLRSPSSRRGNPVAKQGGSTAGGSDTLTRNSGGSSSNSQNKLDAVHNTGFSFLNMLGAIPGVNIDYEQVQRIIKQNPRVQRVAARTACRGVSAPTRNDQSTVAGPSTSQPGKLFLVDEDETGGEGMEADDDQHAHHQPEDQSDVSLRSEPSRTATEQVGTPPARPIVRRPKPLVDGKKRRAYIRHGMTNVLEPSANCTRWITGKFHEKLDQATTWGKVSEEQKKRYFMDFPKGFDWDPREEAAIRNAWSKKEAKSYAHITCRAWKSA